MPNWSRRRFLRGAGSVAIGLPLAHWLSEDAFAATRSAPHRYVSLYFGNGLPRKFVDDGYVGPLEPLANLAVRNKIAMLRGFDLSQIVGNQNNGPVHWIGTSRFGKGVNPPNEIRAGGPSLDWVLQEQLGGDSKLLNVNLHRDRSGGLPPTRWYHSWRSSTIHNGELLRPMDVFTHIFGSVGPVPPTHSARQARYRLSVLDSVVEHYRSMMSERSGLGPQTKSRLADHLELVRELENEAVLVEQASVPEPPPDLTPQQQCTARTCPAESDYYLGVDTANWNEVWEINARLYAMALRTGISRFGTLGCTGGGDRYPIPELFDAGLINGSPHELAHDWEPDAENGFDLCVNWLMQKIAFFLNELDDPAWPDPLGGTVLDNTLVLIGTEAGGHRHQHVNDYQSFFVAGAGNHIRPGEHSMAAHTDTELYSTIAKLMGVGERFGDQHFTQHINDLLR